MTRGKISPTWPPLTALIISIIAFHGRGLFPGNVLPTLPMAVLGAYEAMIGVTIEISFIAIFAQRYFGKCGIYKDFERQRRKRMSTLTITRIAHSSVLIDFDGQRVLTDPWFSERDGYYHGEPYGITLEALPRLDGVAVSHDHYDHYDMEAFQAYPDKQVPIAVIRGAEETARQVGFSNVIGMDAWATTTFGPITVTAAPGKHSVPEITYLLQAGGLTVYFGGDTLLIPELSEIPRRFPQVDVALLAINGLQIRPLNNMQVVMNPQDAAEFCRISQPRYAVPIHYTFTAGPIQDVELLKYAGTPQALLREFELAVAQRAPNTTVRVLAPGEPFQVTTDGDSGAQGETRGEL